MTHCPYAGIEQRMREGWSFSFDKEQAVFLALKPKDDGYVMMKDDCLYDLTTRIPTLNGEPE